VLDFKKEGSTTVEGHNLTTADVLVKRVVKPEVASKYEAVVASTANVIVAINYILDDKLRSMGTAREMCTRVQRLRKKAGLLPTDQITAYYSVSELSHFEFVEAEKRAAFEEDGEVAAPPSAAPAGGAGTDGPAKKDGKGKEAKAKEPKGKEPKEAKGGKAPAAAAPSSGEASTEEARRSAAAALHVAVVANRALMFDTLRVHLLPDVAAARPAHAVVIATEQDVLNGAHLTIILTREAVRFPIDDAAIKAVVAKAAGASLTDQASAHATASLGEFGSVVLGSGKPPADGPIIPPAGAAAITPSIQSVTAGVKFAVAAMDFQRVAALRTLAVDVDGFKIQLEQGKHYFTSLEEWLSSQPALKSHWHTAAGDVGAALYDAITSAGRA
jgi:hypothetical protein